MINYRHATKQDCALILYFIQQLAIYEKLENEVVATTSLLEKWLFEEHKAEVIFALDGDKEVGFALFFHNFSTFLGRSGLYLEDLFVLEEYRHQGFGMGLFKVLASIAKERQCGRMEWVCLKWNQPSIDFYHHLGAYSLDDWSTFRLTGEALEKLGE